MLLQEYITPATMLTAIDKQLSDLRADLARIDECKCAEHPHAGARFVADYGRAVLTAAVQVLIEKKAELMRQSTPQAAE
jgi:GTP cyclohydrolase FolE2